MVAGPFDAEFINLDAEARFLAVVPLTVRRALRARCVVCRTVPDLPAYPNTVGVQKVIVCQASHSSSSHVLTIGID